MQHKFTEQTRGRGNNKEIIDMQWALKETLHSVNLPIVHVPYQSAAVPVEICCRISPYTKIWTSVIATKQSAWKQSRVKALLPPE